MMRIAPCEFEPVELNGVRYTEDRTSDGRRGRGGHLQAFDIATGALLWTCSVYKIKRNKDWEADVQDVYIKEITVADDESCLLVKNESNNVFSVNLKTRESTLVSKAERLSPSDLMELYQQQAREEEEAEEAAAEAEKNNTSL